MQKTLGILGLCGVLVAVQPLESVAGDGGWVAIGGSGGGGFSADFSYGHDHHQGRKALVIKSQHAGRRASGHYTYEERRVWNPGYYSYVDRCGRLVKTWHEGYHAYETVKVWVPTRGYLDRRHNRNYRHCR